LCYKFNIANTTTTPPSTHVGSRCGGRRTIFSRKMLAESQFAFRQGQMVQFFAMFSVRQVGCCQDVPKEYQTRGHADPRYLNRSAGLKRSVHSSVPCRHLGSGRAKLSPAKTDHSTGHILAARAGQCSTTCTTLFVSAAHST